MRRIVLLTLVLLGWSSPGISATLLVDTTSDDGSAGFQVCDGNPANANCSLRGALTRAAANAGSDTITFAIPVTDPGYQPVTQHWRFTPASDYPFISDSLVIDGFTQPGASPNTLAPDQDGINAVLKIEIRGANVTSSVGLNAINGPVTLDVRGIAINGFTRQIQLFSGGGHRIRGCFIGTDIGGMNAVSPTASSTGIYQGTQATIGGTDPADRNVISGNGYIGIWDGHTAASPSSWQGNLFGLAADATTVIPGQDYGIYNSTASPNSVIGGTTVAARNLFAGLDVNAIYVSPNGGANVGAAPFRIVGNWFGSDWTGTLARPNGAMSQSQPQPTINVFRADRCGVQIGGSAAGEGNRIANGAAAGVQIATCVAAPILGNVFRDNRRGAIDLSVGSNADGPTPNDPGDPDANAANTGGNRLQNYPVIDSLQRINAGTTYQLTYRVDTAVANATYPLRIDIARGRGGQPEETILTDSYAATDAQLPKTVTFAASALQGQPLVLFATDADGNTSEIGGETIFATGFE